MQRYQAYAEFREALSRSRELLRVEARNFSDPPTPREIVAVDGLRGAVAVLSIAAFEGYLRSLLPEAIERIAPNVMTHEKLPENLRRAASFNLLEIAMTPPRYTYPYPTIASRLAATELAATHVSRHELKGEAFGLLEGNPGSEGVKAVFKEVGLDNLFSRCLPRLIRRWSTPVSQTFIQDTLDELVRRRNHVAHGNSALTLSRRDLRDGVRFLRTLADVLEIELRYHFRALARNVR